MRRLLAALVLFALPLHAQWDPSKPAQSSPTRQSQEIRLNWAAIAQGIAGQNVIADNSFLLWAAGDAAAPTMWAIDFGSVARSGTGLGDTTKKYGDFAAKFTSGAGTSHLSQNLVGAAYDTLTLEGLTLSCGAWVKTSVAASANLCVTANDQTCGALHTGAGTFQWLTVVGTLAGASSTISFSLKLEGAATVAYLSGPTCVLGSVPPSYPQPSGWEPFEFTTLVLGGALTVATDNIYGHWQSPYYGIVQDVSMLAMTSGPVGAALIFDVNTWDGAAYTSMYAAGGRPRIADGATRSVSAPPDSTYARRIIVPQHGTTIATGGEISVDVDQIGSGTAGRDIRLSIRGIRVARPLQQFLLTTD